jgi:hypothetical protein
MKERHDNTNRRAVAKGDELDDTYRRARGWKWLQVRREICFHWLAPICGIIT